MKTVFTTGQVARMFQVAPRTISKWFDTDRLRGYRLPGSQDRRIPKENLIKFCKDYGIPVPAELKEPVEVPVPIRAIVVDQMVPESEVA